MMNSTTNEDWDAKRTKKVDLLLFLFGPSPEIFTIVRKTKTKTKERRFVEIFLFYFFFYFGGRWNARHLVDVDIGRKKNMTA